MSDQATELITAAKSARVLAYAPYSKFQVGAAVLTDDGAIYTGCNVENASYGLTICAERVAICKAVSEGQREIAAIAVTSTAAHTPCGACRQFLAEFEPNMIVYVADADQPYSVRQFTLAELLPERFH